MSVLGPLFIPRKDQLVVPKIKDNPDLEKFLNDLLARERQNELAIQRWANSAPRTVYISGSGAIINVSNSLGIIRLPFGPANASYPNLITSDGNLKVAKTGWYTFSSTVEFVDGGAAATATGYLQHRIHKVNAPFAIVSTYGSISPIYWNSSSGGPGGMDPTVSLTTILNAGDLVAMSVRVNVNVAGSSEPFTAQSMGASLRFEGATPSTVQ